MKQKAIRFSSIIAGIAFLSVFFVFAISNTPATNAASTADFKAGNIIDDGVFYNKNTMTVEEIQAHLNRYMPVCDTWGTGAVGSGRYINGRAVPANTTRADYARQMRAAGKSRYHDPPYVCVQNYYENPDTHETLFDTNNVIKSGMISAAQIIYNAAQKYNINPQVLLVLLKKESYVWGDNWPLRDEYNTVMGYACPDNAPCNEKYFGFYNQVMTAAWQLNYYKDHIYSYNYRPYATNYILYSPDTSCGRKEVYLENLATTSLYIYTPYTPNDAALRNYPGTATCGSYGNRNFFMYFSEWFGSTHGVNIAKTIVPDGKYTLTNADATKRIHVANDSKDTGANYIADNAATTSAAFSFKKNSDYSYQIINSTTNMALDLPNGQATVGAEVKTATSTSSASQKWYLYPGNNGSYYIASVANPSYVLAINGQGKLVLAVYNTDTNSLLKLAPVVDEKLDGDYIIETKSKQNLVLNLNSDSNASGTNINVASANNTAAQRFRVSYDDKTGYYKITSHYGAVLSLSTPATTQSNLQITADKGDCSQRFMIIKSDSHYSIHPSCNLSLTLEIAKGSTDEYTNVWAYTFNGSKAQYWNLVKAQAAAQDFNYVAPSQPIADGNYIIHSALKSNYVLDAFRAEQRDGTNVAGWSYDGTAAQIFTLKYNAEKDAYTILNPGAKRVIDLSGGSATKGKNVQLWTSNNTCAQYWKIKKYDSNNYNIVSTCNENYVLDISGGSTANGANVQVWTNDNSKEQRWYFEKR